MIKFALRRNLIYPLQLLIFSLARDIEKDILGRVYKFDYPFHFTILMFIGEILAGLIIYLYQKKIISKKKSPVRTRLDSVVSERKLKTVDGTCKIMFLIFCAGLMDFVQTVISLYTPKFSNISSSIGSRLGGFLTIVDALYYYFVLRFSILRHQFFSLCGIGICLIIIIITEFIFQEFNIFLRFYELIIYYLIIFIQQFCSAMVDSTEKYLFEYNNNNPFYILLLEGIFGFILSLIYGICGSPLYYIGLYTNYNSPELLSIVIILLVLYIILSGLKNAFRVQTTKIFSPMTTTFIDYLLNPIYLIIYFALNEDFLINGKRKYAHFFINLFLALIITLLGFIYNEFIIIFCCGLEKDTYQEVSNRASLNEEKENAKDVFALYDLEEDQEENNI